MTGAPEHFEARYRALRDQGAEGWGGDLHSNRAEGWRVRLAELARAGTLPPRESVVLELGSGTGTVSVLLHEIGYRAISGIDISLTAVEWARERARGVAPVSFDVGDATRLARWGDGSVDFVVDGNCFHCLIGDQRARCLAEVRRVLRSGGSFLVSTMVGPPGELEEGWVCRGDVLEKGGVPRRTLVSRERVLGELREAGFHASFVHEKQNPWWNHLTAMTQSTP